MQATILTGLAWCSVFAAIALIYWGGYMSGMKDGTEEGFQTGITDGKAAGQAEAAERIRTCLLDTEQLKTLREKERRDNMAALEAVMLDADQRIATYARRAATFTDADLLTLSATAKQLELAGITYTRLQAADQARFTGQVRQQILNMAERLRVALAHTAEAAEQPTQACEAAA